MIEQQTPAQRALARLVAAYPTPHVDSPTEAAENLSHVEHALKNGLTPDVLVAKLVTLSNHNGPTLRHKLSTLIRGRYWEARLQQHVITARGYQPPTAAILPNWKLEP